MTNVVETIKIRIQGDGTGLERKQGVTTFGLTEPLPGDKLKDGSTVSYVPDPDNDQNTIFWVQDAPPNSTASIALTYPPE